MEFREKRSSSLKKCDLNLLDLYLQDINKIMETTIHTADYEIESAAKEWVTIILKSCAESNVMFEVDEIIQVGSSTDNTKASNMYEMDFMIILRYFHSLKSMKIQRGCREGYLKIWVKQDTCLKNCCYKNLLQTMGVKMEYRTILQGKLQFLKTLSVDRENGKMKLSHLETSGVTLHWIPRGYENDPMKIKGVYVDIMHTLKIERKKCSKVCYSDIPKSLQDKAFSDEYCYLVIKPCEAEGNCWLQSFAITERNLTLSMSDVHKKCYKSLKWLFVWHFPVEPYLLKSYLFKTATLYHTLNKCQDRLSSCFISILEYIEYCIDCVYMPSLFVPGINILKNIITKDLRKKLGDKKIFDSQVEKNARDLIGQAQLEHYYDSVEACYIVECWRRILGLFITVFKNACDMSPYECNIPEIQKTILKIVQLIDKYDDIDDDDELLEINPEEFQLDDSDDLWFIDSKPVWEHIKELRCCYQKQIHKTEIPVFSTIENQLKQHPLMKHLKTRLKKTRRMMRLSHLNNHDFVLRKRHLKDDYWLLSDCEIHTLSKIESVRLVKVRKLELENYVGNDFD